MKIRQAMHCRIFLSLWSFHVLLNFVLTFHFPRKNGKDGYITVKSATASSISLKWKFQNNLTDGAALLAHITPRVLIGEPATLKWDESVGLFVADYAYTVPSLVYQWNISTIESLSTANSVLIRLENLKFPEEYYNIRLQIIDGGPKEEYLRSTEAKITARTKAAVPTHAPKAGTGCFSVYEVYEKTRKVKVYWQGWYGKYEFLIFREGKSDPIYAEIGPTYTGNVFYVLGMQRHYAVLRGYSEVGVSKKFSVVDIPPQKDIDSLPTFPIHLNLTETKYSMSWQKPANLKVVNYTIFWVDTLDEKASKRIQDFVYLPGDKNSFEVTGKPWVELGLSVNTETSSSGLRVVPRLIEDGISSLLLVEETSK